MMRRRLGALVVVTALGLVGACSDDGSTNGAGTTAAVTTTTTTVTPITGTITVYAAQSLSNAFTDMGEAFEAEFPGTSVTFNFAASSTLVTQIFQGAPADVFASADQPNMDRLVDSGLMAGTPQVFAENLLQIVVAKGNPKGITGLADLARGDVVTVLCAPAVPCGNYARLALSRQGISVTPKSNEQNVAAVISRVQTGEADVGVAYVTDVLANNKVDGVSIPIDQNVVADYPLASLKGNQNPVTSDAFVTFVKSSAGQAIMAKYSFLPV